MVIRDDIIENYYLHRIIERNIIQFFNEKFSNQNIYISPIKQDNSNLS